MGPWLVLPLAVLLATAAPTGATGIQDRVAASQAALQEFGARLQGELAEAMQTGGPVEAIRVCNQRAPEIAAEISAETGWSVGRTSLKLRNAANAPDEWERTVLEDFDSRRAAGTPAADLTHHEVIESDGESVFRFMRAIPTAGICLACHGTGQSGEIRHALETLYPDDAATGYSEGDLRGAFTVIQRM